MKNLLLFFKYFRVNEDSTAIFTRYDFLARLDVQLPLRWNLVVATAASVTLDSNYCKLVAGIVTNTCVSKQQTWLDDL